MTPGLAGFVVRGDAATWEDMLDGVLAALQEAFGLEPEPDAVPGGSRRRTWLDTFDWRLYRAGLALEYVTAHRAGELVLTGTTPGGTIPGGTAPGGTTGPGAQPLSQAVAGWRTTRSCLWSDLPEGPVTERITSLIAPRALLPAVTVASSTTVTRLLNGDGKTVARLFVERPVIDGQPLPPRISVAEVRGYQGQARRAARAIAQVPGIGIAGGLAGTGLAGTGPAGTGLRNTGQAGTGQAGKASAAGASLLSDALAAVGRRAGDYSNKVDARLTADMPAPRAAAVILLALLDNIAANVTGVLRDTDSEFLHDLRVSVRRTRSAIKLMGDALPLKDTDTDRFAAEFKWLGDVTTPVRDLDVHLLGFDALAAGLRAARPEDLVPFRAFLAERRVREFRALARNLRSPRFTQLMDEWRRVLTPIAEPAPEGRQKRPRRQPQGEPRRVQAEEPLTAGALAAERTGQAFRKAFKRGSAIGPDSPAESLHDLRKRCKELRYALEFFAPLHDKAAYAAVLGDLKKLQDCLGEFQDSEVQVEEIRALAAAMMDAGPAFDGRGVPTGTLLAMGELTAGLAASQEAARQAFENRFAAFAGPEGQKRMKVLLGGHFQ